MIKTILIDQDEVLTDFCTSACRAWGKDLATQVMPHWKAGEWSVVPPLAEALRVVPQEFDGPLTDALFWQRITELGEQFWVGLEETPWAMDLVQAVGAHVNDWYVVTSPSRCPTSYSGKVRWAHKHLGRNFDRLIPTRHKHLFANPHTLLIDDRDANCDAFRKAGGWAIVFPRHWNSKHEHAAYATDYAKERLRFLCDMAK